MGVKIVSVKGAIQSVGQSSRFLQNSAHRVGAVSQAPVPAELGHMLPHNFGLEKIPQQFTGQGLAVHSLGAQGMCHAELAKRSPESFGNHAVFGQLLAESDGLAQIEGQVAIYLLPDHGYVPGAQGFSFLPAGIEHFFGDIDILTVNRVAANGVKKGPGRRIVLPGPGVPPEEGKSRRLGQFFVLAHINFLIALRCPDFGLTEKIINAQCHESP